MGALSAIGEHLKIRSLLTRQFSQLSNKSVPVHRINSHLPGGSHIFVWGAIGFKGAVA